MSYINLMIISVTVITHMIVMVTIVTAVVRCIMIWPPKEEMVMVGVGKVDSETPFITTGINRTIEIIYLYKSSILTVI